MPTPGRADHQQAEQAPPVPGRPVALIVDDDKAMLESCPQVLQREGFQVVSFPDGESALKGMRREKPDVLIVDLKMPGMCGEEFLRRAKQLDPEAVAVVVTGYPELSSAVEVMKAGAHDFLPKPFGAEELRVIARRALQKRRLALAVAAGEREKKLMRDNFVAMVSHQLKSPAACVKECLDAARGSFGGRIPEGCLELLDRAAARAQLLLDLMDDWLTLARVESGGLSVAEVSLDLEAVARDAMEAAREAPHHNDVSLALECERPGLRARGDADALRELMVNLIDNAMRYTPDGGSVTVRLEAQGESAVIAVADDGPGIPPEEQSVIFEPFFRGDSAKKRHGTGLGLAIVKQIAVAHGARVCVESELGKGTVFRVHLPRGESL